MSGVMGEGDMQEVFKVVEPSGKTYLIFADGHAEGFQPGAVICNRIPSLLVETAIKEADRISQASAESK